MGTLGTLSLDFPSTLTWIATRVELKICVYNLPILIHPAVTQNLLTQTPTESLHILGFMAQ